MSLRFDEARTFMHLVENDASLNARLRTGFGETSSMSELAPGWSKEPQVSIRRGSTVAPCCHTIDTRHAEEPCLTGRPAKSRRSGTGG